MHHPSSGIFFSGGNFRGAHGNIRPNLFCMGFPEANVIPAVWFWIDLAAPIVLRLR